MIVDAIDNIQRTFRGGGDQDLLHPLIEIALQGLGLLVVLARGLDDEIASGPVGLSDALVRAVGEGAAVDRQLAALPRASPIPGAMHRVELEQVRGARRITGGLIDLDQVDPVPTPPGAKAKTSHAAEAVDTDTYTH